MSYTYLNREVRGSYLTTEFELGDDYAKGTTYEDYSTGKPAPWILLSEEQLAFRESNPTATIKEVIETQLDPERQKRNARSTKMQALSQARETHRVVTLDGTSVYTNSGVRRQALYDGVLSNEVTLAGKKYDMSQAKVLVGKMDSYDSAVDAVYSEKMSEINSASTVEDIEAVDVTSGFPEDMELTTDEVKTEVKMMEATDPKAMAVTFAKTFVNKPELGITDNQSLEMQILFPIWGEEGAEFGKEVPVGFKLRVVKRAEDNGVTSDILYKVIQQHTLQQDWEPGVDTASLYNVVDVEHEGTLEDPIPYFPPMEIFNGKFYIQDAVTYKCTRDSGQALSYDLSELVGTYVELVE